MAVINFLGGLTGAYTNIKAGYQEAQARDRAEEDRKFQLEQRDLESKKIKATKDEMERQEKLRTANAGVSLEETVEVPDDTAPSTPVAPVRNGVAEVDGDANPVTVDPATGISPPATRKVTRQRRMEDVYRDFAKNSQSVGDTAGYLTMNAQAVQAAAHRASSQFTRIAAASTGKTTEQLAEELRQLYDTDILPGKVGKVTRGADGSVDIQFIDNETQQTFTQNFKDAGQLMTVAQSYFDPANYAKQVEARRAHLMKLEEERNKVHLVGPRTVAMRGDGQQLGTNAMYSRDYDNDGSGSGGGGGGGGGGRGSKAPPARGDVAMGILSDAYKTKGSEAGPGEFAAAMDIVRRIVTEDASIPEERAARVAQIVAANPALAKPMIDPKTGLISSIYTDDEGGRFVITKNLGNSNKIPVDDKGEPMLSRGDLEDGAERVLGYITSAYGTKVANLYREAAFDGTGVKRAALHKEIAPGVTAALQDDPRWPGMTEEQRSKAIYIATHRATENQLNLIMKYGKPPERPPSAGDKLKAPVAGLGPGVPKSVVDARQRQADAKAAEEKRNDEKRAKDEAQAEANNALRKEIAGFKDSDIYSMTPEEADKFEKKYRPVLSVWQSKKLIDRALGREPGDDFRTPMGF